MFSTKIKSNKKVVITTPSGTEIILKTHRVTSFITKLMIGAPIEYKIEVLDDGNKDEGYYRKEKKDD